MRIYRTKNVRSGQLKERKPHLKINIFLWLCMVLFILLMSCPTLFARDDCNYTPQPSSWQFLWNSTLDDVAYRLTEERGWLNEPAGHFSIQYLCTRQKSSH